MSGIDEFTEDLSFENYIVLSKRDVIDFCKIVEPLTKASIDEYGKCALIRSLDDNSVEFLYKNSPFFVTMRFVSKSGKRLKRSFAVPVEVIKKLAVNSYASLVFVEDVDLQLALGESLLLVETKPLDEELYKNRPKNTVMDIDRQRALYTFRRVGSLLSNSDKQQEKIMIVRNNNVHINTAFFISKIKNPFGDCCDFIIYNMVVQSLGILSELSKNSIKYGIEHGEEQSIMSVLVDGTIYCEFPIGGPERVEEFFSPVAQKSLDFEPNISILNDSLYRILTIVRALPYLSDIITISFEKDNFVFGISTVNFEKHMTYTFKVLEGTPEFKGDMKVNVDVLRTYFEITGSEVKYAFVDEGLGIKNENGIFLIRRN